MKRKHNSLAFRIVALLLVCVLAVPVGAAQVEEEIAVPYASYYLTAYKAYVYAAGSGKVQVWFHVTGTDYMDEIGALSIRLYESTDNTNWTQKRYYSHTDYYDMLDTSGKMTYVSCVDYQGVAGRYYKAYVCIWAGKDGDGDSRYFWTSSVKAT